MFYNTVLFFCHNCFYNHEKKNSLQGVELIWPRSIMSTYTHRSQSFLVLFKIVLNNVYNTALSVTIIQFNGISRIKTVFKTILNVRFDYEYPLSFFQQCHGKSRFPERTEVKFNVSNFARSSPNLIKTPGTYRIPPPCPSLIPTVSVVIPPPAE